MAMARGKLLVTGIMALSVLVRAPAAAGVQPTDTCAGLTAEAVLVRSRNAFHVRPKPAFVVYTISRRETVNGLPDFENTYTTRVWYRLADGIALTRRVHGNRADGPLISEQPRFNAALDPGPPTADIFQLGSLRPEPVQTASPKDTLPEVGSVSTHVEADYKASFVSCDPSIMHLRLDPRRDPDRNRLRELWIDRQTLGVLRFVATDRLYRGLTGIWDPDRFDARFGMEADVPVIRTIHAQSDAPELGDEQSEYHFDAIVFPDSLPDWYFEPRSYRSHIGEAPNW
jgi:hypothetical protein